MRGLPRLRPVLTVAVILCSSQILRAQPGLPAEHPKMRTTQRVFDNLVRAIGDGRSPPGLLVQARAVRTNAHLAWFDPQQHRLTLEERAYDLCVEQGADSLDAIAFLLGHELAHFYENHGWVGDFGNGFADLEVGRTLTAVDRSMEQTIEVETQADHAGGFYGYLAGYRTLDVAPELLAHLYHSYGLEDQMPGYPALAERQEIARRAARDLQQLIPVFDAGHRILLINHHETAARCFEYIARTFSSREILNNAGVARTLQALALFEADERRVVYPFEVDATTRLRGGTKAGQQPLEENVRRRKRLLALARTTLERARQRDPEYASSYINLACVADLQGEAEEAALWAEQALRVARRNEAPLQVAHALIARGIARLHRTPPDSAASRQDFTLAGTAAPLLARSNLAGLNGTQIERAMPAAPAVAPEIERISGFAAADYSRIETTPVGQVPRDGLGHPTFTLYERQDAAWSWLLLDTGYNLVVFLETQTGYGGATGAGVRIGDGRSQVLSTYGPAAYSVAGRHGMHDVYPESRLILRYGPDQRVQGWVLYHVAE